MQTLLKNTTLKITPQRLAILNVINKYGHISIEDIYEEIKSQFPSISLATIYKNIHTLKNANIVSEIHPQDTKPRFEITKKPHGHFICKQCNSVYDFEIENNCNPKLDKIANINDREIYLYGICKDCLK